MDGAAAAGGSSMMPHKAARRRICGAMRRQYSSSGIVRVPLPIAVAGALAAWTAIVLYLYSRWLSSSLAASLSSSQSGARMPPLVVAAMESPSALGEPDLDQQLLSALDAAAARFEAEHWDAADMTSGSGIKHATETASAAAASANGAGATALPLIALEVASATGYDPTNVEPDDNNRFRCVRACERACVRRRVRDVRCGARGGGWVGIG